MEQPKLNILTPTEKRQISRLPKMGPIDKTFALKFPIRPNPAVNAVYADRKIPIINKKNFKNLSSFKKEDLFLGSLRIF